MTLIRGKIYQIQTFYSFIVLKFSFNKCKVAKFSLFKVFLNIFDFLVKYFRNKSENIYFICWNIKEKNIESFLLVWKNYLETILRF
jgi:hypothetical protein